MLSAGLPRRTDRKTDSGFAPFQFFSIHFASTRLEASSLDSGLVAAAPVARTKTTVNMWPITMPIDILARSGRTTGTIAQRNQNYLLGQSSLAQPVVFDFASGRHESGVQQHFSPAPTIGLGRKCPPIPRSISYRRRLPRPETAICGAAGRDSRSTYWKGCRSLAFCSCAQVIQCSSSMTVSSTSLREAPLFPDGGVQIF